MEKIAIVGDYESIIIYKSLDWDIYCVNLADKNEVLEVFKKLIKDPAYKKILVVENVYQVLSELWPDFDKEKTVVPLTDVYGTKDVAKQKYKKLVTIATSIKLEDL
jgi:vacuolar-type H+-ATPase subunit F/Vma7